MPPRNLPTLLLAACVAHTLPGAAFPVALALGTSPVTLLEMVNAYATIAHEGVRREPLVIKRIRASRGR